MVKPPKIRHSKSRKDPVTIELGPDEVSRIPDELRGDADPATVVDEQAAPPSSAAPSDTAQAPTTAEEQVGETPVSADGPAAEPGAGSAEAGEAATHTDPQAEQPTDDMSKLFARDAEKRSQAAAPAAQAQTSRRGGVSMLVAGLIGGFIALAGAGALQWSGAFAPGQIAVGEQAAELDALRAEIAALRQQSGQAAPDPRIEELDGQIAALRSEIAELGSAPGSAPPPLDEINTRLAELEGRLASLGQGTGAASDEAVAALEQRLATLEGLKQQIAGIDQATRTVGENVAALGARVEQLEGRLADFSQQLEEQAAQPQMAAAVAAAALKSAIDRGGPFAAELETYAAVAPETPELAELRAFAEIGVPTRAQLAAQVPDAAAAMAAAARPIDPNAGIFDRLISSAGALVDVRPVGPVRGNAPGAIVARLEQAVLDGDLAAALAEYEKLPQAAKDAGAEFIAKARARQQTDALVGKALAGALKAPGQEG